MDKEELAERAFSELCGKYVQRADARQQAMGLQYTTAETHDLARYIARFTAAIMAKCKDTTSHG